MRVRQTRRKPPPNRNQKMDTPTINQPHQDGEAACLESLVRNLLSEISLVEERRDALLRFLRTNGQYWRDGQSIVDFHEAQIARLRSYLPNLW
jgi:hypothetical protein